MGRSGSPVATAGGRVSGHRPAAGVHAYLGIPYAAPPVGSLRFRRPLPHPGWDGVRTCLAPGPGAPQSDSDTTAFDRAVQVANQSEDCLWLNVWTPSPAADSSLPVLVWFHGGAFVHGSARDTVYDGSLLAGSGLVVVTVNTRLGALGMLDLRSLVADGQCNLALHDQAAALDWVRASIRQFGGDPSRIVVAGESVGGTSALAHLGSSLRERPRRAIAQSSNVDQFLTSEASAVVARAVLAEAGVDPTDRDALESVPSERLLTAQDRVLGRVWAGGAQAADEFGDLAVAALTPFLPAQDDTFVHGSLQQGLADNARGVNLLIGSTRDESALYRLTAGGLDREWVLANARRAVQAGRTRGGLDQLLAHYSFGGPLDLESLETDRYFRAPALRAADVVSTRDDNRVLTYRIDLRSGPAAHMVDVPLTFGTLGSPLGRWFSAALTDPSELDEVSRHVRESWTSFCTSAEVDAAELHVAGSTRTRVFGGELPADDRSDRRVRAAWVGAVSPDALHP